MPRAAILGAARRLGLEPALRRVQRALSYERRRDWEDNRRIEALLAATLGPGDGFVDVGACEGDILRHAVRLAPEGRHFAFEPLPELAAALRARFPAVDVRACAVHDTPGTRSFHRVRSGHWYSSLQPLGRAAAELEPFPVEVIRLDDVLPEDYVPAAIKIDVEGAEAGVIAGALRTLRRHRPLVIFEHGAHARHFPEADLFALLTDEAGLSVFDIDGAGPYTAPAFAARVRRGDIWTFVARQPLTAPLVSPRTRWRSAKA
jgi:FkbM family methyltransferase